MKHEIRAGLPVEIRAEGDAIKVSGYAAVFNQRANIGDMFEEQIAPGAFRDAIGRDDVVFLVNHEGLPLARTRSGTLTLTEDSRGLLMSSELDSTDPDVQALIPKMRRGDLDKMSFGFQVIRQEWDESGDMPVRTINEASLFDVSVVTSPAYQGTDIGLRSLEAHRSTQEVADPQRKRRLSMKLSLSEALAE